ncbi:MAG: hypothetical protein WBE48_10875 [Xanthobacteraceae bacterium]|jgi:hypothetical protein
MTKPWKPRPQNLPRPDTTRTLPHLPGAIFYDDAAVVEFADRDAADTRLSSPPMRLMAALTTFGTD